jgi:hypothetical protein
MDVSALQRSVLLLEVSTLEGPEMHLDVSALKRSVLLLEVSTLQRPELHLDVSALQRSVLMAGGGGGGWRGVDQQSRIIKILSQHTELEFLNNL